VTSFMFGFMSSPSLSRYPATVMLLPELLPASSAKRESATERTPGWEPRALSNWS